MSRGFLPHFSRCEKKRGIILTMGMAWGVGWHFHVVHVETGGRKPSAGAKNRVESPRRPRNSLRGEGLARGIAPAARTPLCPVLPPCRWGDRPAAGTPAPPLHRSDRTRKSLPGFPPGGHLFRFVSLRTRGPRDRFQALPRWPPCPSGLAACRCPPRTCRPPLRVPDAASASCEPHRKPCGAHRAGTC